MADDGVIQAYLRELAFSVRSLADADDIVLEAEDHLLEAAERLVAEGYTASDAGATAVARFGSAELIARVCVSEARRTAAVPTRRTRLAGLAAVMSVVCLIAGQAGNVAIEEGGGHGSAVFVLCMSFPLFIYGLWGLRARHGGLSRVAPVALGLAVLSPVLSLVAGWGALALLVLLLALALGAFVVEMLRASVLPVLPIVLLAAGPIGIFVTVIAAAVTTINGGDFNLTDLVFQMPLVLSFAGFVWLGWHLWQEDAVDADRSARRLARA